MDWKKIDLANFIKNKIEVEEITIKPTSEKENTGATAMSDVSTIVSDVNTTMPTEEEEKNMFKR